MHRTYIIRTNNSFELPPQPLLEGQSEANWDVLIPQLANFGVQINEAKESRLRQADPVALRNLLTTLFEIDTSPPTTQ